MVQKRESLIDYIYEHYYSEILDALRAEDPFINYWHYSSVTYLRSNDDDVVIRLGVFVSLQVWTIEIRFVFNDGITNFRCKIISKCKELQRFQTNETLSDYLLPIIRKEEYSVYANEFLSLYYPEALNDTVPINIPTILKRMGLKVEFVITEETYEGKILFEAERVTVLDIEKRVLVEKVVAAGTILINLNCEKISKNLIAINSIVMHECIHWWLHRKCFGLLKLFNPELKAYIDDGIEKIDKVKFRNKYFAELQARSIAPIVLANDIAVEKKYKEIISKLESRKSYHSKNKTYFYAMYKLAEFFNITPACARVRLKSLGFTDLDSVRNGMVAFSSSVKLNHGQTYLLDIDDAIKAINNNPLIKKLVEEGKYLYIDGLFILNDDRFVIHQKNRKVRIRKEALSDVSKCCLLFSTILEEVQIEFDLLKFDLYSLYSGEKNNNYHRQPFINYDEQTSIKNISEEFNDLMRETNKCIEAMDKFNTFHEKFDALLIVLGFKSNRMIAKLCQIDKDTIKSYREGKSMPDERYLMRIIGGLQLKPMVARYLLKAARRDFTETNEPPYPLYTFLINTCYNYDLDYWRKLINETYRDNHNYQL